MTAEAYTTWGPVRGDCGHVHRTIDAAERCIRQDSYGCAIQGGYSDREVRVIEGRGNLDSYDVTRGPGRILIDEKWRDLIDD